MFDKPFRMKFRNLIFHFILHSLFQSHFTTFNSNNKCAQRTSNAVQCVSSRWYRLKCWFNWKTLYNLADRSTYSKRPSNTATHQIGCVTWNGDKSDKSAKREFEIIWIGWVLDIGAAAEGTNVSKKESKENVYHESVTRWNPNIDKKNTNTKLWL